MRKSANVRRAIPPVTEMDPPAKHFGETRRGSISIYRAKSGRRRSLAGGAARFDVG